MLTTNDESNVYKQLRDKAETQLHTGTTPATGHWSMGVDALRLLHRLSSEPGKADDALKLLHELQVHQVELELQNEEIAANEQVATEDLNQYRLLFDCAPFAYCLVDLEGAVIQANRAAAVLFDLDEESLKGQRIGRFLKPQSQSNLMDLLQRVAQSGANESCVAEAGEGSQKLKFMASTPSSTREHILLACCDY